MQNFSFQNSIYDSFFTYYPLQQTNYCPTTVFESQNQNFQSQNQIEKLQYEKLERQCKELERQNQELKKKLKEFKTKKSQKIKRRYQRRNFIKNTQVIGCPYPKCKKQYNSDAALSFHLRKRHNGGTKFQRFQAAKNIIYAMKNHNVLPQQTVTLPPDYLQKIKQ